MRVPVTAYIHGFSVVGWLAAACGITALLALLSALVLAWIFTASYPILAGAP